MPVYPVLKNAHSERFSSKGDCRPNFQNPGLFLASRVITCPSASRRKRCFLPQLSPVPECYSGRGFSFESWQHAGHRARLEVTIPILGTCFMLFYGANDTLAGS